MKPPPPARSRLAPRGFTAGGFWLGVVWPSASIVAACTGLPAQRDSGDGNWPSLIEAPIEALFPTTAHLVLAVLVPLAFLAGGVMKRPSVKDATLGFAAGLSFAWTSITCPFWTGGLLAMLFALIASFVGESVLFALAIPFCFGSVAAMVAIVRAATAVVREGGERRSRLKWGGIVGAASVPILDLVIALSTPATTQSAPTVFNIATTALYFVACVIGLIAWVAAEATAANEPPATTADCISRETER